MHLLIKDFLASKGEENPFHMLSEFITNMKGIVKFFKTPPKENAKLWKAFDFWNLGKLQSPVKMWLGSVRGCLQSLLDAEEVLKAHMRHEGFLDRAVTTAERETRQQLISLLNQNFIFLLEKGLFILNSIDRWDSLYLVLAQLKIFLV